MQEAALPLSRDNLVINELFREYLMFNGYRTTLSVLLPGEPSQCHIAECLRMRPIQFVSAERHMLVCAYQTPGTGITRTLHLPRQIKCHHVNALS